MKPGFWPGVIKLKLKGLAMSGLLPTMLALVLAAPVAAPDSWRYDDEATDSLPPAPAPKEATPEPQAIPPKPSAVIPIPIPPIDPDPKPDPTSVKSAEKVERRPTAVPEQPDASLQELISRRKAEVTSPIPIPPSSPAPRRQVPVERTCDRSVARLAPRWRLADSTGKVWVAYDRAALVTHVQTVNAAILVPEPIFTTVVSAPVVEFPPTTVVSTPMYTSPAVSTTYTTLESVPTTTFFSAPSYSSPFLSMPAYTGMGGGCAGGMCR